MRLVAMRLRAMQIIDPEFARHAKKYLVQSALAVVAVAAILYFVETLTHAAIIAALGSSTFIVFAMPDSITAQPRRLIGGHLVGLAVGAVCYFGLVSGLLAWAAEKWESVTWGIGALSVGLAIFLMAVTNTEHPPAAATALGVVIHGWANQTAVFIMVCAIGLAIARRLLRPYLIDLFAVRGGGTPDYDPVDREKALRAHATRHSGDKVDRESG